jgi:D-inositol-3-phosphate glycosyltransferase
MFNYAIISYHTSPFDQPGQKDGGGMNVYVRNLASHLCRLGNQCHVFTRAKHGESITEIEPGLWLHSIKAGPFDEISIHASFNYLEEFKERLITRFEALSDKGIYFDVIHANYWLSAVVGHDLKHLFQIPLITTYHSLAARIIDKELTDFDELRKVQERKLALCSDAIITSCKADFEQTIALLQFSDLNRMSIVAPGFDRAIFMPGSKTQARKATGLKINEPIILYAGRIQYLKGLDLLAYVFKNLKKTIPEARLIIAGGLSGSSGESYLESVKEVFKKNNLSQSVDFVGAQDQFTLSSYYRAADVVVIPSRVESFGLVALEAHACGVPVVAFKVGGIPSVVLEGSSGFLADLKDLESFQDGISQILLDRKLASSFSQNAIELSKTFSWKKTAKEVNCITSRILSKDLVACSK